MKIKQFTKYLNNIIPEPPYATIILGSGLGSLPSIMNDKITIPYSSIPDFPLPSTLGHKGEWIFGYINNKPILCANGRFHYYEGFTLNKVALPITISKSLNTQIIIITNSAGCLNKNWDLGDIMYINGYIDYTFLNNNQIPINVPIKINPSKYHTMKKAASNLKINLREGIYTWTLGPTYETAAEIEDIIKLHGSAVGMSTVPEIKKAIELDIEIMCFSCLTNYGAGLHPEKLTHQSVLEISNKTNKQFSKFIQEII